MWWLLWEVHSIIWNRPRHSGVIAVVSSQLLLHEENLPQNALKEQIRSCLDKDSKCIGDSHPPHTASQWDPLLPQ